MRNCGLDLKNIDNMTALRVDINRVISFFRQNNRFAAIFFAVFYLVGITGTVNSSTHNFFLMLFPWVLLLSFLAILFYNESGVDLKTLLVIFFIAVSGFFIEVAGIRTHQIFGNYTYGSTLGLKIFETPLIIGVNWGLMIFATGSVVQLLTLPDPVRIIFASLLMVLYDILMEFAAPVLGMWNWAEGTVPVRNYIAWFVIASVFHSICKIMRVKTCSALALPVLICQVVFFIVLVIFFRLAG
jgi:bisanhydrobacterioruberin hydratase